MAEVAFQKCSQSFLKTLQILLDWPKCNCPCKLQCRSITDQDRKKQKKIMAGNLSNLVSLDMTKCILWEHGLTSIKQKVFEDKIKLLKDVWTSRCNETNENLSGKQNDLCYTIKTVKFLSKSFKLWWHMKSEFKKVKLTVAWILPNTLTCRKTR